MKVREIQIKKSIKKNFHKIKSYLTDTINDLKKSDKWKSQLAIAN